MKVGVIGSGVVGQTLAAGFLKHGHEIEIGTREPAKLKEWSAKHAGAKVKTLAGGRCFRRGRRARGRGASRARSAEACRPQGASEQDSDRRLQSDRRRAADQRRAVVLHHADRLANGAAAEAYPSAHLVKAFNSVGNAQMVNPHFAGGRPTMFICGNDASAKRVVTQILDQFGWDTEDMGAVEAARAIEPLCMLWCIPGVGKGDWSPHAFKLLR
jgi:predicted dinucleotide-binding enzyme